MDKFIISGGRPLKGEVTVSGTKNSAVSVLPASILVDGVCTIENLPYISDVANLQAILKKLGATIVKKDKYTVEIDARRVHNCAINDKLTKKMRASYYLLGALLGRFKKAEVAFPGGCDFGTRPIDQHIKGFEALGADIRIEHGMIKAEAKKLKGTSVYLDVVSVGATINIMLAAVLAEGVTTIENAAKEPHVVDVANFLNAMGAHIRGAGTDVIRIRGVERLNGGAAHAIIPDMIEAGTFLIAGAVTKGDVTVHNVIPKHLESVVAKLIEMGFNVIEGEDWIRIMPGDTISRVNIKTLPYPGFPTDLHPQMAVLLSQANGTSMLTDEIWDRFQYVDELKKMGAKIKVEGRVAIFEGPTRLTGASLKSTDLRAGAAMVIAGLASEGNTEVTHLEYIDRGYECFDKKLRSLGADIQRVHEEEA